MLRIWQFCVLGAMAFGQQGLPDPAFEKVPFDEWLKGGDQSRIKWTLTVRSPRLTETQRLSTLIEAKVAADEFVKRDGPGQVVVLVEIRDRDNREYRTHDVLNQRHNPTEFRAPVFELHPFFLPGDYEVAAAVYDTESKEHSLKRMKLHIPKLARDPLPGIWRDLPNVAFSANPGRLYLPLRTEKPVRIEVVMNLTVNRDKRGRKGFQGSALFERLSAISGMEILNGSMYVTVLDVDRRKVHFSGRVDSRLWKRLPAIKNDPNKADVTELRDYKENAQFFVSEIRKRLEITESPDADRVLIVLSPPLAFPKEEDLTPIQATPEPGSRVFYIRCESVSPIPAGLSIMAPTPGTGRTPPELPPWRVPAQPYVNNSDSLARTLKPLEPRLFDVTTPEQFRRALAAIVNEISRPK